MYIIIGDEYLSCGAPTILAVACAHQSSTSGERVDGAEPRAAEEAADCTRGIVSRAACAHQQPPVNH